MQKLIKNNKYFLEKNTPKTVQILVKNPRLRKSKNFKVFFPAQKLSYQKELSEIYISWEFQAIHL